MKKHLLLLSALFLLTGCEGAEKFTPTEGGTYDSIADQISLIDQQTRVDSLGAVTAPAEIGVGEVLSTEEVTVVVNWVNGESETTNEHPQEIQLDTSRVGEQTGVVVYGGKTTTFTILVKEEEGEQVKTPTEIQSVEFTKDIAVGDNVKLEDVNIVIAYEGGETETVHPTSVKLDTSLAGNITATVTYGNLVKEVIVVVSGEAHVRTLQSIDILSGIPEEIPVDGTLQPSSVTLTAVYSDGSSETVHPSSIDLDTSAVGTAGGVCHYQGLTAAFQIEVKEDAVPPVTITGIEVTNAPSSVEKGGSIALNQITITVKKSDNSVEIDHPTSIDLVTTATGTVTATVHFGEFQDTFKVNVYDPSEEEEEEEVLMCTYRLYFSYSYTTKYNPITKKDEDCPLLSFSAPMLSPLGHAPEEIADGTDNTKVSETKVRALGAEKGFVVDPAFPNFLGFSAYGLCLSTSQLWDFTTSYKQQPVINLYGIWVD